MERGYFQPVPNCCYIYCCYVVTYVCGVVHDARQIVRNVIVHSVGGVKLRTVGPEVVPFNFYVICSVNPLLLVPKAKRVAYLVHRNTKLGEKIGARL